MLSIKPIRDLKQGRGNSMRKYILIVALLGVWIATMAAAAEKNISICNINGIEFRGGSLIVDLDSWPNLSFKNVTPKIENLFHDVYVLTYPNMRCLNTVRAYNYLKTLPGVKSVEYSMIMRMNNMIMRMNNGKR